MRVLCIHSGPWRSTCGDSSPDGPKYMEDCEVVEVVADDYYKIKGHEIASDGIPDAFHKKWFIPLSNIDETKMVREDIKEKA